MSAARRRITKKQLKDDKFVDTMLAFGEKARTHQRSVAVGVVALLVLVLLGTWATNYFKSSGSESRQAFSEALKILTAATDNNDEAGFDAAREAFRDLREDFDGKEEGRWAIYFMAYCQEKLVFYSEAEALYREYLEKDPEGEYEIPARLGVASCNAGLGRVKVQADMLRELAASEKVPSSQAKTWLYQTAQIYMDAGYYELAHEVLEELKPEADESMLRRIEQDLAALKARRT